MSSIRSVSFASLTPNAIWFFFQAEDGIRYRCVTGVQTCALPICAPQADERAVASSQRNARSSSRKNFGHEGERSADVRQPRARQLEERASELEKRVDEAQERADEGHPRGDEAEECVHELEERADGAHPRGDEAHECADEAQQRADEAHECADEAH